MPPPLAFWPTTVASILAIAAAIVSLSSLVSRLSLVLRGSVACLDVSSEVGLREARARASVVSFRLLADRCSLSDHGLMMWCRMCSSMHQELVRMMRHMCRQMRYSGERRAVCDFECFVLYFSHVVNHILDKKYYLFFIKIFKNTLYMHIVMPT